MGEDIGLISLTAWLHRQSEQAKAAAECDADGMAHGDFALDVVADHLPAGTGQMARERSAHNSESDDANPLVHGVSTLSVGNGPRA